LDFWTIFAKTSQKDFLSKISQPLFQLYSSTLNRDQTETNDAHHRTFLEGNAWVAFIEERRIRLGCSEHKASV